MKNSKFLRSKNLLKSLEAEELKSLNDERRWIATKKQCTINDNDNEQQLKTTSARNDGHSSVIPEKDIPVISSERSDERSAVSVRRCSSSVIPEIRSRESMVNRLYPSRTCNHNRNCDYFVGNFRTDLQRIC